MRAAGCSSSRLDVSSTRSISILSTAVMPAIEQVGAVASEPAFEALYVVDEPAAALVQVRRAA